MGGRAQQLAAVVRDEDAGASREAEALGDVDVEGDVGEGRLADLDAIVRAAAKAIGER